MTSKGAIEEHSLKLALDILEFMMKKKVLGVFKGSFETNIAQGFPK